MADRATLEVVLVGGSTSGATGPSPSAGGTAGRPPAPPRAGGGSGGDDFDPVAEARKRLEAERRAREIQREYEKLNPPQGPPAFDPVAEARKRLDAEKKASAVRAEYEKLNPPAAPPPFDPVAEARKRLQAEQQAQAIRAEYERLKPPSPGPTWGQRYRETLKGYAQGAVGSQFGPMAGELAGEALDLGGKLGALGIAAGAAAAAITSWKAILDFQIRQTRAETQVMASRIRGNFYGVAKGETMKEAGWEAFGGAGQTAGFAAVGAAAGSVIPGVGTAAGAAAGAIVGAGIWAAKAIKDKFRESELAQIEKQLEREAAIREKGAQLGQVSGGAARGEAMAEAIRLRGLAKEGDVLGEIYGRNLELQARRDVAVNRLNAAQNRREIEESNRVLQAQTDMANLAAEMRDAKKVAEIQTAILESQKGDSAKLLKLTEQMKDEIKRMNDRDRQDQEDKPLGWASEIFEGVGRLPALAQAVAARRAAQAGIQPLF